MDGNNQPAGNLIPGMPYGSLDFHQNPMQMQASNSGNQGLNHPQVLGNFSTHLNQVTNPDKLSDFLLGEPDKADRHHNHHHPCHTKNSMNDDEEHGMNEDATDSQTAKGKKGSAWHRMKWTDSMVKLLITAVSYTGEDLGAEQGGGRRNSAMMHKKGKWKAISKVMGERGCLVSPQQCEDKFNDLNKRYKRLTDILGRGTTCDIVAKPELLDRVRNITDKMKDEARKIMNSRHLFYEEMCSYHNNNRISLPEDPALQRSLQLALRCKEECDAKRRASGDTDDEDDHSPDTDCEEDTDDEHYTMHANKGALPIRKRVRYTMDQEDVGFGNSSSSQDCGRRSDPHSITVDITKAVPDGTNLGLVQQDLAARSAFEKQRLQIEVGFLELAKQRLEWERSCKEEDIELERMRLENEQLRNEIRQLELVVRQKELEHELKLKGSGNHTSRGSI